MSVIECGELLGDLIEPADCAGIVVGVVAGKHLSRQSLDFGRVERHWLDIECHRLGPGRTRASSLCRSGRPHGRTGGERDAGLHERTPVESVFIGLLQFFV